MVVIALKTRRFVLGTLDLELEVVADPEALITDPADEYQVPCWAEIWPAAVALAEYLAGRDLEGRRVLELGCGLGLPGLVAALKGAAVTFNDYHPEALEIVAVNARRLGVASRVRFNAADWRSFDLAEEFDLILASDVMYDPRLNPHLLEIFRSNLAPGGELLVSHPSRPDTFAALETLAGGSAWRHSSWTTTVEVENDPLFPRQTITLHRLGRGCPQFSRAGLPAGKSGAAPAAGLLGLGAKHMLE